MPRHEGSPRTTDIEGSGSPDPGVDEFTINRPTRLAENGYALRVPEQGESSPDDTSEAPDDSLESPESLSPTADFIESSAARIAGILRSRAESRQAREQQNEAYASVAENISATRARERQEFRDSAKKRARGFGHAALRHLQRFAGAGSDAAFVAAGTGILAGEKAKSAIDKLDDYTARKAAQAGDYVKNQATNLAETVTTKVESSVDTAADWTAEKYSQTRETYLAKRDAARQRRATRREAWAAKRAEISTTVRSTYERNKARIDVARGVGSVVVSHLSEVYGQLKDTKNVARTAKGELEDTRQL